MTSIRPCRVHSINVRQRLHADPSLGCGNFLSKVLAEDIDREGWIFELEREWCTPTGRAYQHLSLADLESVVEELSGWYIEAGVRKGEVVLTYTEEGLSQFLHALSLIAIGAIPAPVNWRMPPNIVLTYYHKYGFDHLVIDDHGNTHKLLEAMSDTGPRTSNLLDARPDENRIQIAAMSQDSQHSFGTNDDLFMLCHSSGTTGVPKAVMFGHQQFFFGKRERLLHFIESGDDRMFSALPHSHSAGFSYLMTAVMLGMPTHVQSDITGQGLATQLQRFQPTIMAGFPQSYAKLAESLPDNSVPSLRRCYNTGDTAHEAHVQTLLGAAPQLHFHDGFGASELGMALFSAVSSRAGGISGRRNVGKPVPFAEARIVDEMQQPLPQGEIGYLSIHSPTITSGYFRDELLTERCRTPEGGWLTGDVGYLDNTGSFFHLDRAVDVMKTPRGPAYTLELEELVLGNVEVPDITFAGVTLTPRSSQAVVGFLNLPSDNGPQHCERVLDLIDTHLQESLGGPVPIAAVNLDRENSVQVGATGKVLKNALRDGFWREIQARKQGLPSQYNYVLQRHF